MKNKTELIVKTMGSEKLGLITISDTNEVIIDEHCPQQFRNFVEAALQKGIRQRREVYDADRKMFFMMEGPIKQTDPLFPLAFRDFLKYSGYKIEELHPEVDEKIKKLLATVSDDNEDKKYILEKLPTMSHLEKTFVLEVLTKVEHLVDKKENN